jgi:uncharacterized short protein YbdD (DUF466 family)
LNFETTAFYFEGRNRRNMDDQSEGPSEQPTPNPERQERQPLVDHSQDQQHTHPHQPPTSNFPVSENLNNNVNMNNNQPPLTKENFQKNSQNNHISSLPLQMLIYFHYHFAPLFFLLNICLFTYKGIHF